MRARARVRARASVRARARVRAEARAWGLDEGLHGLFETDPQGVHTYEPGQGESSAVPTWGACEGGRSFSPHVNLHRRVALAGCWREPLVWVRPVCGPVRLDGGQDTIRRGMGVDRTPCSVRPRQASERAGRCLSVRRDLKDQVHVHTYEPPYAVQPESGPRDSSLFGSCRHCRVTDLTSAIAP